MIFDPLWIMLVGPVLLLGILAQGWVRSAFAKYSRIPARCGLTGAEVAREIMRRQGISGVTIEPVAGVLSDHYDPRTKVLRLSAPVHEGRSVAAISVAAHETGHAVQDATRYPALALRSGAVALASTSQWGIYLALAGLMFRAPELIWVGAVLYAGAVLFTLITLPVEFNASSRALRLLGETGILARDEMGGAKKVLSAAALTYVVAAASAIATLIYLLLRAQSRN